MKKVSFIYLSLVIVLFSIISCSNKNKDNSLAIKTSKNSLSVVDTSFLNEKNFVYKNLINTNDVKYISKKIGTHSTDSYIYSDSTYQKAYVALTPNQKIQLIAPIMEKDVEVNPDYVSKYMLAYFISKQNKIGNLKSIIVYVSGDDYSSLIEIFFDKSNKPINSLKLDGGFQPGPTEIGDSLISYEKTSYSYINKNRITTYRIKETDYTDSTKKAVIIDSNVFVSVIGKAGKITTKQTVKAHFRESK